MSHIASVTMLNFVEIHPLVELGLLRKILAILYSTLQLFYVLVNTCRDHPYLVIMIQVETLFMFMYNEM